jgi:hypothetical protein
MTFCRCRACRLGIVAACVGAWVGVNTAGCYAHEAPDDEPLPLAALSTVTLTTANVSGIVVVHGSVAYRPAAMADEPIRVPTTLRPRVAVYDRAAPPTVVVWPSRWTGGA